MAVHYKFASSKDFDTVMFDGSFITVAELKRAIFQQKKLGKSPDVDLVLTNASTKEGVFRVGCSLAVIPVSLRGCSGAGAFVLCYRVSG